MFFRPRVSLLNLALLVVIASQSLAIFILREQVRDLEATVVRMTEAESLGVQLIRQGLQSRATAAALDPHTPGK